MRPGIAGLAALLFAGCGSAPPVPDWQQDARSAMDAFEQDRMQGRDAIADRDFARALSAVSSTGRLDLVARVRLVRCAIDAAVLVLDTCPDPRAVGSEGGAEEIAYAAYLAGAWEGLDVTRLPSAHAAIVTAGDDAGRLGALRAIDGPASRLVASAVLLRKGLLPPAGLDMAVETASAAGHRRALLAWLGLQERAAVAAGDAVRATAIRRRIEVAGGG